MMAAAAVLVGSSVADAVTREPPISPDLPLHSSLRPSLPPALPAPSRDGSIAPLPYEALDQWQIRRHGRRSRGHKKPGGREGGWEGGKKSVMLSR